MNLKETIINIVAPQEAPVLPEEVDMVVEAVLNPPNSAVEYAQNTLDMFNEFPAPGIQYDKMGNELPTPTPAQQALSNLIEGGNVPGAIGLVHIAETDEEVKSDLGFEVVNPLIKVEVGLQAFDNHINLLRGEDPQDPLKEVDPIFVDPQLAREAEHQKSVLVAAKRKLLNAHIAPPPEKTKSSVIDTPREAYAAAIGDD